MNDRFSENHESLEMRKSAGASNTELERFRFEIDEIDNEICSLLEKRFSAVEHVRSAKSAHGQASPIRPAREFAILRRLAGRPDRLVSPELKVRLWRIIMSASTLSQASITIHMSATIAESVPFRLLIQEHYASFPVMVHQDDGHALACVGADAAGLCIVTPNSSWAGAFLAGEAGEARIMGCLPLVRSAEVPELLILGHGEPEATGQDETILIGKSKLPETSASWQIASGDVYVTSYSGFHLNPDRFNVAPANAANVVRIAGYCSRLAGARP